MQLYYKFERASSPTASYISKVTSRRLIKYRLAPCALGPDFSGPGAPRLGPGASCEVGPAKSLPDTGTSRCTVPTACTGPPSGRTRERYTSGLAVRLESCMETLGRRRETAGQPFPTTEAVGTRPLVRVLVPARGGGQHRLPSRPRVRHTRQPPQPREKTLESDEHARAARL